MAIKGLHLSNYEFTMDEPIKDTVVRDAKSIYRKILHICFHQYNGDNTVKKWDLWGSFIVYLTLSVVIFLDKEVLEKKNTFAYFFVIFIVGHILVALNLSLLHINIHFFQSVCIISYSLFPLVFSSFVNLLVSCRMLRFLFALLSTVWSSYNCILILAKFIKSNRLLISFFPICLLQFFIATFLLIK
ncbi:protein YIPF6, putative [Plasmodium ovale]|uniref:Protein YIPF n=1 Tax=Plasmodium ovale TaxID=36330 RepID=A0A1D3TIM3_PLAOA|nr:protein YIPF6, putative [Plasmodium ovale]